LRIARRRTSNAALASVAVGVAIIAAGCGGSSSSKPKTLTPQQVIAQATPSVVRLTGKIAAGSGFVIDATQGLVLTNAHVVVGNTGLKAQIGNDQSSETPARVLASSPCDDLAVVKLVNPPTGLKALTIADSSTVKAGDQVTALGFPVSPSQSAQQSSAGTSTTVVSTTGTVSVAHQKTQPGNDLPTYEDTIQMQTPISPGNSGGPLLNSQGQVVGINSLTNGGGNAQAQNFAIASSYAKRVLPTLETGKSQGYVGWRLEPIAASDQNLQSELQDQFQQDSAFQNQASQLANQVAQWFRKPPPTSGLYDLGNDPGSPADKALQVGYLIESINGSPVSKVQDVCDIVSSASPGQTLRLQGHNIDATNNVSDITKPWQSDMKLPNS